MAKIIKVDELQACVRGKKNVGKGGNRIMWSEDSPSGIGTESLARSSLVRRPLWTPPQAEEREAEALYCSVVNGHACARAGKGRGWD